MSDDPKPQSDGHEPKPTKVPKRRGRPPKRPTLLVPSELRRTLLAILDEEMEVSTPRGTRKMTTFEAVMRNLVGRAAKANPTALNHLMRLLTPALEERMEQHKQVWIAEYLRKQMESPDPDKPEYLREMLLAQIEYAKDKY